MQSAGQGLAVMGGTTALAGWLGCDGKSPPRAWRHYSVPGQIMGAPAQDAHILRDPSHLRAPSVAQGPIHDCIVVGSGIAGCAAVWKLRRGGVQDVIVLELEETVGGTSAWGEDGTSAYPWAAHYVTTPDAEADCLIEVLTDLGVLTGVRAEDGWPIGNPAYVVRHPAERLFIGGRWTDSIAEMTSQDRREQKAMNGLRDTLFRYMALRDKEGRRAFTLPIAYGSYDPDLTRLDQQSMHSWLREHEFTGPHLQWNIDYACRDDYGSNAASVSAWAGIHYFACRYADSRYRYHYPVETFTWPEGNGFLIRGLLRGTDRQRIHTNTIAVTIENHDDHVEIVTYHRPSKRSERLRARRCIFAGKLHVAPYVVRNVPPDQRLALQRCTYAPWLVAQVHVKHPPRTPDQGLAWDNVHYESNSLGYVVADHQERWKLGPGQNDEAPTVMTYYQPFAENPVAARDKMLTQDHAYWVDWILNDLAAMHPDIGSLVTRIDVKLYGHAMIVPEPGFIWSSDRALRTAPIGHVHLASADASGLPLFEEACFAGIRAAEEVLHGLGKPFNTSLGYWKRA